jgi:hypothetical protein
MIPPDTRPRRTIGTAIIATSAAALMPGSPGYSRSRSARFSMTTGSRVRAASSSGFARSGGSALPTLARAARRATTCQAPSSYRATITDAVASPPRPRAMIASPPASALSDVVSACTTCCRRVSRSAAARPLSRTVSPNSGIAGMPLGVVSRFVRRAAMLGRTGENASAASTKANIEASRMTVAAVRPCCC